MEINIRCPPSMIPHLQLIQRGEYDVPYNHPRPIILDVGANVGGFAVWAIKRWPGCEIYCYEPLPDNFAMLEANVDILATARVSNSIHAHNFAIGDPLHTQMFLGKNNCGEASFFDLGEQARSSVSVATKPPTVMPPAQILKIDTEGCEIEILSGLKSIDYDVVLLEYHSERNRREADALLRDYTLTGGYGRGPHRGILKYMHSRLIASSEQSR
ncbi:FkbM family methyltransferase [Bradyrhizobium sp. Pear76]|uniref:FkbM family methyltransferase n=1 Tax=Bradyrhizobium oropedii TaxID=1571201 RepID=UPI001E2A7998|nr:FkbM family methyltransferase [Bradyrhizobium oropedii]MCC8966294.1 FkbM family methyltransferase [Bradyrhizobium oropedii]